MNRDDVIEAMAKAHWSATSDPGNQWGNPLNAREERHSVEGMGIALSTLEAMGIVIVPVEATERMIRFGTTHQIAPLTAATCYAAMIAASPFRNTDQTSEGGEG